MPCYRRLKCHSYTAIVHEMTPVMVDTLPKGMRKIWSEVYAIAERALERGEIERDRYYSVEYVGQKFNNTPCTFGDMFPLSFTICC